MKIRVVLLCGERSPFGRAHLEPVLEAGFDVAGVVFANPRRWSAHEEQLRGLRYDEAEGERGRLEPLGALARPLARRLAPQARRARAEPHGPGEGVRARGIPTFEFYDVNAPDAVARLRALGPDVVLCADYPQRLEKDARSAAARGTIRFHPSPLPRYRGPHPQFWGIAHGETTWAVSAHYEVDEPYAGPVVAQRAFDIEGHDYDQLERAVLEAVPGVVRDVARFLADPQARPAPQDPSLATHQEADRDLHHRVFWQIQGADEIGNLIRTQRAFCFFRGERMEPLRAYVVETNRNLTEDVRVPTGTVVDVGPDAVIIKVFDGCVALQEVGRRGRRLSHRAWVRRERVSIGERLD